jgi:hypothetical protein
MNENMKNGYIILARKNLNLCKLGGHWRTNGSEAQGTGLNWLKVGPNDRML